MIYDQTVIKMWMFSDVTHSSLPVDAALIWCTILKNKVPSLETGYKNVAFAGDQH